MGVTLDSLGFDSELQALYMAVARGRETGQKRKLSDSSLRQKTTTSLMSPQVTASLTLSLVHELKESFQTCMSGEHKRKCFSECPGCCFP